MTKGKDKEIIGSGFGATIDDDVASGGCTPDKADVASGGEFGGLTITALPSSKFFNTSKSDARFPFVAASTLSETYRFSTVILV